MTYVPGVTHRGRWWGHAPNPDYRLRFHSYLKCVWLEVWKEHTGQLWVHLEVGSGGGCHFLLSILLQYLNFYSKHLFAGKF